ncbi:MAG: TIR domain-containing protein [Myxococcales bacterium]|nr:TIR domain-containing protein [Myxococcales bacterium]
MTSRVYVSLDPQDANQRRSFEELAARGPHVLDAHDRLLTEPLLDARGRRVWLTPTDRRSEPLRATLRARLAQCARLLVLIGPTTIEHPWVDWEIRTFFDLKHAHAGPRTWKYLRGMRLRGYHGAEPAALAGRATVTLDWSPAALTRWLDTAL